MNGLAMLIGFVVGGLLGIAILAMFVMAREPEGESVETTDKKFSK